MLTPVSFSEDIHFRHLRDEKNHPYATVASRFVDGILFYGVAVCNDVDNFDRSKGREVAEYRLNHAFNDRNNTHVTSRERLENETSTTFRLHGCVYNLNRPNDVWFSVDREDRSRPVSVTLNLRNDVQ